MGLFGLFGSDDTEEHETDDKPCNVSGHDWPEWKVGSLGPYVRSTGFGSKMKVYTTVTRNCRKCDKFDSKDKTIGYISVDEKNEEIEVV